ncbi:MAG: leucine-rich repeat domain-containing protein [Metamycoplasmataceae bacterium]
MKLKKNDKNVLIGLLSIIGLGSILGAGSIINKDNSSMSNDNELIGINENQNETPKPYIVEFTGEVLTKDAVVALEWDKKEEITLKDWEEWAPNVTQISEDRDVISGDDGNHPSAAFSNNAILKSIEIPAKIKVIQHSSFYNTTSLERVTFEPGSQLKTLGWSSFRKSNIASITLPEKVEAMGPYSFRDTKLVSFEVPDGVKILESDTFYQVRSLDTVTFGPNTKLIDIRNNVFFDSGITKIIIPDTVAHITNNAFTRTGRLTNISMPASLQISGTRPEYGFTQTQWNGIVWRPFDKPFLGTVLTISEIIGLGWNTKSTITIQDWVNDAPNVIHLSPPLDEEQKPNQRNAAFWNNTTLQSIEIPKTIQNIDYATFEGATRLTSVTFEPGSNLRRIGQRAFIFTGISTISLPDTVSEMGSRAFEDARNLTSFRMPDNVTTINNNTFAGTHKLGSLTFGPDSKLFQINDNFMHTSGLRIIDLPDTVRRISNFAFQGTVLTDISIPEALRSTATSTRFGFTQAQFDAIKWKGFQKPFRGTVLTSLEVEKLGWNTKESITLQDWINDAPNVIQITPTATSGAFDQSAFANNTLLKSIEIPAKIKLIHYGTFYNTTALNSVTFEPGSELEYIGNSVFQKSNIPSLNLPDKLNFIGEFAFSESKITSLIIPELVTVLQSNTFDSAKELIEISFAQKSLLRQIRSNVFKDSSITTITIPSSTSNIANDSFSLANSLINVTLSSRMKLGSLTTKYGFTQDQWDNINWIIEQFTGSILTKPAVIDLNWHLATSISQSDWDTLAPNVVRIGTSSTNPIDSPFANNLNLQSIFIPSRIILFNNNAFLGAKNLASIVFDSGSRLTTIGQDVFKDSGIKSIDMPNSVRTIGSTAFQNTTQLPGNQIYMPIELRISKVAQYGFTQDQWDSINWKGTINLTDRLLDVFTVEFEENSNIAQMQVLKWNYTSRISTNAEESGLALQYALGSSTNNLLIQWANFDDFRTAIINYSQNNDILFTEMNIYARMYLPKGTGPNNSTIGNLEYTWDRSSTQIYHSNTGTIANFFTLGGSSTTLPAGKFIRTYSRVLSTWSDSLSAEGSQANDVKIFSLGNVFDIQYWQDRGVKLEVRSSNTDPWLRITQFNLDSIDASTTNEMQYRLSVVNEELFQIYGSVASGTTPPGIMTPIITKPIVAKKLLAGVMADDLTSAKLSVSGTTNNISIVEDPTLYTVSGMDITTAKTFFEIKYSYDGITFFSLNEFKRALSGLRSIDLNSLNLSNFRVRYEFTPLGQTDFYSPEVSNDLNASPSSTKTLNTTNITKTIDATSQIDDVNGIIITGSTVNLIWSNLGSIPDIAAFVRIEYGKYVEAPDGSFSYVWSTVQPTSIVATTPPPGQTQFPLAIRFVPQSVTDRVQIGSINAAGVFTDSDTTKGYEVRVDSIPTIINIDTTDLVNRLILSGYVDNLNNGQSPAVVERLALELVSDIFRNDVQLVYSISILPNDQFFSLTQLSTVLTNYANDYTNSTSGILFFDNGVIPGVNISAKFIAKDPMKFTVSSTPQEVVQLNTSGIKTKVDLRSYVNILKTEKVIPSGNSSANIGTLTFPSMPSGNVQFGGLTYEQITQIILSTIDVEFKAPGFHGDGWVPLSNITSINVDNELFIRFNVKAEARNNVELSLVLDNDYLTHLANGFKLNIALPIEIQVTSSDLINEISLKGNTKELEINDDLVYTNLINKNPDYDGKVQILYSIGRSPIALDPNDPLKTEFNKADFLRLLTNNKTDIVLAQKQITARYALAEGIDPDDYKIRDERPAIMNVVDVLLFINKSNYYQIAESVTVSGTSSGIVWGSEIDELIAALSEGLTLQYSTDNTVNANDPNNDPRWTVTRPTTISSNDKFLAIRLVTRAGYVFEEPAKVFVIDTSNVLAIIEVQSAWLEKIKIGGNTRNINIDIAEFDQFLIDQNIVGREFIEIQYFFGGTVPDGIGIPVGTEWLSASQIKLVFETLKGAKNDKELILFRNTLRARYTLNDEGFKIYRLNINGTFSDEQFPSQPSFYTNLVTSTLNMGFKGYINLDLINKFNSDNFEITGSDKLPELVASDAISSMLDFYKNQTTTPFEIYYTNIENDFSAKHILFDQNGFKKAFHPGFTINLDTNGKPLPIWFQIVARPGYDVWENGRLLNDGKIIEITNFSIQPRVSNPLTSPPDIRFVAPDGSRFYQGLGSLSVYVSGTNILVDRTFLNTEYPLVQPDVLKLEYNVSDALYSNDEMNEVIVDPTKWTDVLPTNLRVGQYVMTRVAVNNDIFEMIDPDARTAQVRVSGLVVNASQLTMSDDLVLTNTDIFGYSPLDGQAKIEIASINPDDLGNYLGADLAMSVEIEIHKDPFGRNLTDINGFPLVVRDATGATSNGNYKDALGRDILDINGDPIPILTIERDGSIIPAPPLRTGNWQTPIRMNDWSIEGSFSQEDTNDLQWRLFQDQFIRFSFLPRIGEGSTSNPDFLFDGTVPPTKEIKLDNIKYIIQTNGINYNFDQNQLKDIVFESSIGDDIPYTGTSYISTELQITRIAQDNTEKIYKGSEIEEIIKIDFNDQVHVKMQLTKKNGSSQIVFGTNISEFNELQNGDIITISLESKNDKFLLPKPISPLSIVVKNLFVKPLDKDLFQFLRPNFTGSVNGSGSFNIRVTNPDGQSDNNESILGIEQWYEYQVWNPDKTLKTSWTKDETKINNLVNGDKVEWKLVNSTGILIEDYYNTLLGAPSPSGITFRVVNVEGREEVTFRDGIGSSQTDNPINPDGTPRYPENSGWIVSGLKSEIVLDPVQQEKFELALKSFQPTFSGVNQFGSMTSNILNDVPISKEVEIVWYASGSDGIPRKITDFKNAGLSNGDIVWATIAPSQYAIENNLIIDESIAAMESERFVVSGLTIIVNSSTQTLIISLITASSVLLVGITGAIVFMKRNSKLKGDKNFKL